MVQMHHSLLGPFSHDTDAVYSDNRSRFTTKPPLEFLLISVLGFRNRFYQLELYLLQVDFN